MSLAAELLRWFDHAVIAYVVLLDVTYLVMAVVGWAAVDAYVRRRPIRDYETVATSPLSPPVTVLVPAHDEAPTIVASLNALLGVRYPQLELLVIDDGSTDGTLGVLREAFDLVPVDLVPRAPLTSAPVTGTFKSAREDRLVVIAKENGGKADALNAGLRYAWTPLVCSIDADTLLDPSALARLVWEFESEPDTVAAGGIVRVVNGSTVEAGRVTRVRTPGGLVANLQILEYLRAFLGGRVAWSRLGMLLIISGAFGLFRRQAVVDAGGYDTGTVGEDAELVLRLHRSERDAGRRPRVVFFPDPICWTEAPTSLRVLGRQRDRWQRGLLEMLWKHRGMIGRRRYGAVGTVALPYFIVFEALGPLVEVVGYLAFGVALGVGAVSWPTAVVFLVASVGFGFVLSYATLLMEERAFARYPGWRCLGRLLVASVVENVGYRQWLALVRARAFWTLRRDVGWGAMTRAGFGDETRVLARPAA